MPPPPSLRPDFEQLRASRGETRSPERLRLHYEIESWLAARLLHAPSEARPALYSDLYRQLFEGVSDHPQHAGQRTIRLDRIAAQAAWLGRWLGPSSTYVEIGCGDASLTKTLARQVHAAVGVDVTPMLVTGDAPDAFRFLHTNGIDLDLPDNTADLVYSNQLMEHLHAEDAQAQLREVYRVLKPGGRYVCCTPNRLTGPHDISVYFGYEPSGFHMREYDHRTLNRIFRSAGFRAVRAAVMAKGHALMLPAALLGTIENLLERLPRGLRARVLSRPEAVNAMGVNLVGVK